MRKGSLALLVALLVLAVAWGGSGGLSSPEPAEGNPHSCIPDEVWANDEKLGEAARSIRSSDLRVSGVPFAGFRLDPWTATIYVGLTEIADKYTDPIRAIVDQLEGVNVEFFEARFTEAELRRLQIQIEQSFLGVSSADMARLYTIEAPDDRDELRSEFGNEIERRLADHGVPLTLVGVDIRNNGLLIGLREIRPEYIAAIRDVVGDEVPIEFIEGQVSLHRTGRHRPLLGGIKLTTRPEGESGSSTLSFAAEANGNPGFVMTGHAGFVGDRVWQPTAWWWNRVGQISVNPAGPRYSDAAFVPNDNINAIVWRDRNTVGWRASYDTEPDQVVMKEGITTGFTEGVIALLHVTFVGATNLYGQVLATYDSDYGDSGAPVFRVDAEGNAIILGTHWGALGDYAIYSPVEGIAFDLDLDGVPLQGVTGLVYDSYWGFPLQGAEVWVHETGHVVFSSPGGSYRILLGPGTYTLTASYPLFHSKTYIVQVVSGQFTTLNFALDPLYPGYPYPMDADDPVEVTAAAG